MELTRAEHVARAEELIDLASGWTHTADSALDREQVDGFWIAQSYRDSLLREAQVHATLAQIPDGTV